MSIDNYYLLDDVVKYNLDFNRKAYENKNKEEIIEEFKEFYAKRLPIDLTTWVRVNGPSDKMIYKKVLKIK